MGIINRFEQKVFLNLSRHLWNFLGVSGFIAFSTGVILFLNSTFIEFPKSKSNYFGEGYGTIGRALGMSRATVASIVKREKVAV